MNTSHASGRVWSSKLSRCIGTALFVALCTSAHVAAQQRADNYDAIFENYLAAARALPPAPASTPWMSTLFADVKARNVNDLVTVHVIERVVASGSADSSLDKNSSTNAAVGGVFGLDPKFADWFDPAALARYSASSEFKGGGATSRSGTLSAVMTARVTEVLPNGDLLLEGVREIDINGDRQIIVLTGVVRPTDVGPGNVVPSTAVGQMRIRYFGRGLIKDNLTRGWLVRVFNKIF
jgi:flagellar L-ring protein precursor FlgH